VVDGEARALGQAFGGVAPRMFLVAQKGVGLRIGQLDPPAERKTTFGRMLVGFDPPAPRV